MQWKPHSEKKTPMLGGIQGHLINHLIEIKATTLINEMKVPNAGTEITAKD